MTSGELAAALSVRAKLAMIRGDTATVHHDAQQSLTMFRELGDRWGQPQATGGSAPRPQQPATTPGPTGCTERACAWPKIWPVAAGS